MCVCVRERERENQTGLVTSAKASTFVAVCYPFCVCDLLCVLLSFSCKFLQPLPLLFVVARGRGCGGGR